jgi:hypothetical protein
VPFLRLTRDQRGYETTFLLHAIHPGDRPRELYWYRSAPGIRVGRPPLDEDAIRAIEERHPEIDFDWPHILEAGTVLPPEVERRPERQRRRPPRPRDEAPPVATSRADAVAPSETAIDEPVLSAAVDSDASASEVGESPADTSSLPDVLVELVGREIAGRLRARFVEISDAIEASSNESLRALWRARAHPLNPASWTTPSDILHGVQHADALFDELRREINAARTEVSSSD